MLSPCAAGQSVMAPSTGRLLQRLQQLRAAPRPVSAPTAEQPYGLCSQGSREILHEHILIQQESLPEETFHSELDRKPSLPVSTRGSARV